MLKKSLSLFILCLLPFSAMAEEEKEDSVRILVELGFHSGGDKLYTAYFTDGSTETIEAGNGLSFAAGAQLNIGENLDVAITYGIKEDSITAANGSIDWTRYPLNALVLYKLDKLEVGGGLTYHMSPKLEGSGVVSGSVDFDNAFGFLLDARYFMTDKAYLGLRATSIDYKVSSTGQSFDGNSFGITLGGLF